MATTNVSVITNSCTHGATNFGIVVSVGINADFVPLPLKSQGALCNTVIGFIEKNYMVLVTWLADGGSPITPGTSATFTETVADIAGGGTNAYACTHVVALGFSYNHNDRGPATYTQAFMHANATDEDPFSA